MMRKGQKKPATGKKKPVKTSDSKTRNDPYHFEPVRKTLPEKVDIVIASMDDSCMTIPSFDDSGESSDRSSKGKDNNSANSSSESDPSVSVSVKKADAKNTQKAASKPAGAKGVPADPDLENLYNIFPNVPKETVTEMYNVWNKDANQAYMLLEEQKAIGNSPSPVRTGANNRPGTVPTNPPSGR